jgi:hypothetical protein
VRPQPEGSKATRTLASALGIASNCQQRLYQHMLPVFRTVSRALIASNLFSVLEVLHNKALWVGTELALAEAKLAAATASRGARKNVSFAPDAHPMDTDGADDSATPATHADIHRLASELALWDKMIKSLKDRMPECVDSALLVTGKVVGLDVHIPTDDAIVA